MGSMTLSEVAGFLPAVPWIASAVFILMLVIILLLCTCHRQDDKTQDYGIPGRITIETPPMILEPVENHHTSHNDSDEGGEGKQKMVVERALPDIPRLQTGQHDPGTDTDQTPDSGSECYATVSKPKTKDNSNGANRSSIPNGKAGSHKLPLTNVKHSTTSVPDKSDLHQLNQSPSAEDNFSAPHEYALVKKPHHPYARLSNQLDSDPGTDEYDESLSSGRERSKNASVPSTVEPYAQTVLVAQASLDMSSPSSSSAGPSVEETGASSNAGQAVAGNVPSAEIPYMTPPLVDPNSTASLFTMNGNSSREMPYTVISVREPLERVRKQIQKLRKREHSTQGSSLDEPEGYYMEVPEEEQTYAEIESGQRSGESSTTYDHIEPRNLELPPNPPTVESLKSVARAHSRQASIASMSSFGSNSEGHNTSAKDVQALYSVVDKKPSETNELVLIRNVLEPPEHALEELYAKVQKKKSGGTLSVSGLEDILRTDAVNCDEVFSSRESWSPTSRYSGKDTPPVPPPVNGRLPGTVLLSPNSGGRPLARRHSAEPSISNCKDYDEATEPGYASVGRLEEENTNGDSDSLASDSKNPAYERIRQDSEAEPGYELIRNRSLINDSSDPGYESVGNLRYDDGFAGYELINNLKRTDSDCADPGYERVKKGPRRPDQNFYEPDYECIKNLKRNDSDCADPGYEKVKRLGRNDSDAVDPGYEPIKHRPAQESNRMSQDFTNNGNCSKSNFEQSNGNFDEMESQTDLDLEHKTLDSMSSSTSETSGFILSGDRISIRINCSDARPTQVPSCIEVPEIWSQSDHTTNLFLEGPPSICSSLNETKITVDKENIIDDQSSEHQSNLEYETASSGGSTISSKDAKSMNSKHYPSNSISSKTEIE